MFLPIHKGDISYFTSQYSSYGIDSKIIGNNNWFSPEDFNHMNILKSYLEIWIIPSANPEGLGVVHDGLDLTYRKNKSDCSQAC